jgi:hypothetical protein
MRGCGPVVREKISFFEVLGRNPVDILNITVRNG